MDQHRSRKRGRDEDMPDRASNMEPAEGSRETVLNSESMGGSHDEQSMFSERERMTPRDRSSMSDMRGMGSEGARAQGITNRGRDREQAEQDQLPERGKNRDR